MGMYLNPGNEGFASIVSGEYVDKTGLIALINETIGKPVKLTCISRPRRFGKSFAAKMLCAYYSRGCDSASLFSGLVIEKDPSYRQYLNQFDVVYLDITGFLSVNNGTGSSGTGNNGAGSSETGDVSGSLVAQIRRVLMDEIAAAYPQTAGSESLGAALVRASEFSGHKFFFIIDEWDAIFREASGDHVLQKNYIEFLREIFKNGNVTDQAIAGAYMTGILPIKKYGHQSAISDFWEYSMIEPGAFAPYVGFSEEEVKQICIRHRLSFAECRQWYDGYSFVQASSVYNPSSVMSAARFGYCSSFWTRTETYESLKVYIDMDFEGLQADLIELLGGMDLPVNISTFQNDITSFGNKDDILTLLIHLGYLAYDAQKSTVRIPNLEIRKEFRDTLAMSSHKETARLVLASDQLIADTIDENEAAVAAAIEKAHEAGTSPLFYNNEQALRAVIKAAYISAINDYVMIEELPAGRGYADIAFFPKKENNRPAMLIELKWDKPVDAAIAQIHRNHYPSALKGFAKELLLVGITYNSRTKKHTCRIEKMEIS